MNTAVIMVISSSDHTQCLCPHTTSTDNTSLNIIQHVVDLLNEDGWNFSSVQGSAIVFDDKFKIQNETTYNPQLRWSRKGKQPSYELNYMVLSFLMNGQYYSDYEGIVSMLGLPVMAQSRWNKIISLLGTHVHSLAIRSCQQVQETIIARGEKLHWKASFDGFYLTRGYHSNNSSATLHDVMSDKIAWFTHRTKRGIGSNWVGTSSGAEGDMLRTMLNDVKESGFLITQLVMDHDTSSSNIACAVFPEIQITYCGNHSAKTFHRDLVNLKAIPCKVCTHSASSVVIH